MKVVALFGRAERGQIHPVQPPCRGPPPPSFTRGRDPPVTAGSNRWSGAASASGFTTPAGRGRRTPRPSPGRSGPWPSAPRRESDAVVFLADARAGLTPADEELADGLRRQTEPASGGAGREQGRGRPRSGGRRVSRPRARGPPPDLRRARARNRGGARPRRRDPRSRTSARRGRPRNPRRTARRSGSRSWGARTWGSPRC